MLTVRPAEERGHTRLSWLDSWHTFSFDQYRDPKHMHFGPLRVINEDRIGPGGGFGTHPHRDMEIITYVIEGKLKHEDSLGNGSIISAGEIQKMSAGSGILHSEFNASDSEPVHLLQIWVMPDQQNLTPSYEQEQLEFETGQWKLLGSPDGKGLISIHQKTRLFGLSAAPGSVVPFTPLPGTKLWIQLVKGECSIGAEQIRAGDGLAINDDHQILISSSVQSELLLFEIS